MVPAAVVPAAAQAVVGNMPWSTICASFAWTLLTGHEAPTQRPSLMAKLIIDPHAFAAFNFLFTEEKM